MKEFNGYKKCWECEQILPIFMFYKDKFQVDGFHHKCKDCCSENNKNYYKENKEKVRRYNKEYRERNKEEVKKRNREYFKANPGANRKAYAKRAGYQDSIELFDNPFPSWIEVEYHHIDDYHVIPIPKVIHSRYNGKLTRKEHQNALKPIIEELYDISYQHMINRWSSTF